MPPIFNREFQAIDWIPPTPNFNTEFKQFEWGIIHFARGPGVIVLVLSWVITLYTLWQMVEMHEMVEGKRFDRYHELGQEAFGEKLGLWIVVPQQLIVGVGVDIVYMVTGGKSLKKFYELTCKKNCYLQNRLSIWILVFGSVHLFLAQLPNFNSIAGISLAAAIMSLRWVNNILLFVSCLLEAARVLRRVVVFELQFGTHRGPM